MKIEIYLKIMCLMTCFILVHWSTHLRHYFWGIKSCFYIIKDNNCFIIMEFVQFPLSIYSWFPVHPYSFLFSQLFIHHSFPSVCFSCLQDVHWKKGISNKKRRIICWILTGSAHIQGKGIKKNTVKQDLFMKYSTGHIYFFWESGGLES